MLKDFLMMAGIDPCTVFSNRKMDFYHKNSGKISGNDKKGLA
ncbi:hypothetical protein ACTJKC_15660 [Pedobacter sp. 22226]